MTRNIKNLAWWRRMTLLALLTLSFEVTAKDFGVHGEVFEISEPDMLEYIKDKLKQMEADGRLEEINKHMKNKTEQYVNRPAEVAGIIHTQEAKSWEYDTSHTATEDIKDQDGNIIHSKGTVHNALEHAKLEHDLAFIDGDDIKQVDWAVKTLASKRPAKIILVKGEPFELMKKHQARFYFDQQGILTTKLGITQVPALVSQKGTKLLVNELKLEGK